MEYFTIQDITPKEANDGLDVFARADDGKVTKFVTLWSNDEAKKLAARLNELLTLAASGRGTAQEPVA